MEIENELGVSGFIHKCDFIWFARLISGHCSFKTTIPSSLSFSHSTFNFLASLLLTSELCARVDDWIKIFKFTTTVISLHNVQHRNSRKAVREHSFREKEGKSSSYSEEEKLLAQFPVAQFIYHAAVVALNTAQLSTLFIPGTKVGQLLQQLLFFCGVKQKKMCKKTAERRKEAVRRSEVRVTLCWMTSLLLKQDVPVFSVCYFW